MIPTIEYVQQKFREFNVTMFDGRLPEPPLSITNAKTYLGVCAFRKHRKWHGRLEYSDFKIRISRRFDLPQEEIDDTTDPFFNRFPSSSAFTVYFPDPDVLVQHL